MKLDRIERSRLGRIFSIAVNYDEIFSNCPEFAKEHGVDKEYSQKIIKHLENCIECQTILAERNMEFESFEKKIDKQMAKYNDIKHLETGALKDAYSLALEKAEDEDGFKESWNILTDEHKEQFEAIIFKQLADMECAMPVFKEVDKRKRALIENGLSLKEAEELAKKSVNEDYADFIGKKKFRNASLKTGIVDYYENAIKKIISSVSVPNFPEYNFNLIKGSGLFFRLSDEMRNLTERLMEQFLEKTWIEDELRSALTKKSGVRDTLKVVLDKLEAHINM